MVMGNGVDIKLLIPPYSDSSTKFRSPKLIIGEREYLVTRIVGDFQSPYHKFLELSVLFDKKDLDIIYEEDNE
jgi:hypothetical protein